MSPLEHAKQFATKAHAGQFRRDGVTPYIRHPARVVEILAGKDEATLMTGWLHDVLEDTPTTAEDLLAAGIPSAVVNAVGLLTRVDANNYKIYLRSLSENPMARTVKIADMLANLTDSPTPRQVKKYTEALLWISTQ